MTQRPGGAVCVVRGAEVVREECFGTTDGVTPWTPETLVMCYSVAKPFAALTVLEVVASGGGSSPAAVLASAISRAVRRAVPEGASALSG